MKVALLALLLLPVLSTGATAVVPRTDSIAAPGNKHNLSASGPGILGLTKAPDETRVCVFCHTPHHANAAVRGQLWSRQVPDIQYDLYASSTLHVNPQQPTGSSRLCLSCHDGTIAVGMTLGGRVLGGLASPLPLGAGNLGDGLQVPNLANDHPVSFMYPTASPELAPAHSLPVQIRLQQGQVQCTSCHDPHSNRFPFFTVIDNRQPDSPLCQGCHRPDQWTAFAHARLRVQYPPVPPVPAREVNGCEVCHVPHSAQQQAALLRGVDGKKTCLLTCHNGGTAASEGGGKVDDAFNRPYSHRVGENPLIHAGNEDTLDAGGARRHVECFDCHNPHRANARSATAPQASGALEGVKVEKVGGEFRRANTEYDVCFKCHAETYNTYRAIPEDLPQRQHTDKNQRQRFNPANQSFHPVVAAVSAAGINTTTLKPSFVNRDGAVVSLNATSIIYCHDCHDPHGSSNSHVLLAPYLQNSYATFYSSSDYALCYRCHDENMLLDGVSSSFRLHRSHVMNPEDDPRHRNLIPCSVCHDPHGTPMNRHLINFDTRTGFVSAVTPAPTYDAGRRSCTVSCHPGDGIKTY